MRIARTGAATASSSTVGLVAFYLQIVRIAAVVYGLKYVSPDGPCDPGELVFVGFCNLCMCNHQGVPNQLCARSWCPVQTPLPPRSGTLNNSMTSKLFV